MKRFEFFEYGVFLTVIADGADTSLLISKEPFPKGGDPLPLPLAETDVKFSPLPAVIRDTGNLTGRAVYITQNDPAACIEITTLIQFRKGSADADIFTELHNYGLLTVTLGDIPAAAGQRVRILTMKSFT